MFEAEQILSRIFSFHPQPDDPVLVFSRQEVFLCRDADGLLLPPDFRDMAGLLPAEIRFLYLGRWNGQRCFAALTDLPEVSGNGNGAKKFLCRRVMAELSDPLRAALCRGRKLAQWAASHRFCGACCHELQPSSDDLALRCPECGENYYPQLAPAVIVAVTRNKGRELLLAHNRNFAGGFYSLIAGFVEAGESVEDAVRREIMEECGIKVRNIRYFTSQAWPFPNSLMLAFTAEYDSGTAEPDGVELTDLGWFTAEEHPQLPLPGSVARKVIDYLWQTVR